MKNSSLSLLFSILLLAGCSAPPAQPYAGSEPLMFSLTASDGVELKADFYNSGKVLSPALLLVHMLGSDRTAWKDFSIQAKAQGFTVLAIDLRGHGESQKAPLNTPEDYQALEKDVQAGIEFLKARDVDPQRIAVVGASIGANTAFLQASYNDDVKAAVLLSPGLEYRGVSVQNALSGFSKPVLVAASSEDAYSFESSLQITQSLPAASTVFIKLAGAGHGTNMLDSRPDLEARILEWLAENVRGS